MARVARYSKLIDLTRSTNIRSITYTGTGTLTYRTADSSAVFGTSADVAGIAPTGTCTGNAQQTHYLQVNVTFDDTLDASFGETAGSTLNDFTVSYYFTHPTPQTRLHGGKTLQAGEQTPLDTCGTMSPI
jgi:hypothetical protein